MSMLSEQTKNLRETAKNIKEASFYGYYDNLASILFQAAYTIEALSAKLAAKNMERSDMISRNKLIEEIDKEISGVIVKDTYSKGKNAGLRKSKILAEEQTGANYEGGWIAVEDSLPDTRNNILICQKDGYVSIGYYSQDRFLDLNSTPFDEVIAWQPTPESFRPQPQRS